MPRPKRAPCAPTRRRRQRGAGRADRSPITGASVEDQFIKTVEDFNDTSQEWRRLFSELLGTFFLVLVAAGGGMMGQAFPETISRTAAVVAPALMVLAIILFMGKVSGAHLNPAVSIAFALRGDFPWVRVPGYIVVQLIGATFGRLVPAERGRMFPRPTGRTTRHRRYSNMSAFLMELVLTFGLVSVILGTASGAQNLGVIGALGVGGYIALAGLWGSPISGASMNPARTFGPDMISLDFGAYWVYVAGPIAGAVVAVGCRLCAARRRRRPGGIRSRAGRPVHRGGQSRSLTSRACRVWGSRGAAAVLDRARPVEVGQCKPDPAGRWPGESLPCRPSCWSSCSAPL